jgi:hypothetical protein
MGCTSSKEKEQAAAAAAEKQRKREAATAALNAPKVDPKDFMACKLKGQTIVKEPGSAHLRGFASTGLPRSACVDRASHVPDADDVCLIVFCVLVQFHSRPTVHHRRVRGLHDLLA